MSDLLLSAREYSYTYPGRPEPALAAVDLDVREGEFVLLAGDSGSGKSTLLRAACGLVPHFHGGEVAGTLEVGGMDTREHGPGDLAAVTGTVFQDPESQVIMNSVRAELELPLESRGAGGASAGARGGGVRARPRHRRPARSADGDAVGRGAPAHGSRGGTGHPAAPVAAGRADVAARPGRR